MPAKKRNKRQSPAKPRERPAATPEERRPKPRRIAWDGMSFDVPANWELAIYKFLRRRVRRMELEDEYSIRLEAEWVRPKRKLRLATIMKRYERSARPLTVKAVEAIPIEGLPNGWHASRYIFRETLPKRKSAGLLYVTHELVTAFYACPRSTIFCFFMLHFLPEDKEDPEYVTRMLAENYKHHTQSDLIPWRLYDLAFELPRGFLLENTMFDIGAKLMAFRWRLRRFYLWHFSCADMFLKDGVVLEEWVTGYVNGFGRIPGPVFYPGTDGELTWRRRGPWIFHRDEIGRWCFHYKIRCQHDRERNQVVAWVYNYRRPEDLEKIPPAFRFGKDIFAPDSPPPKGKRTHQCSGEG